MASSSSAQNAKIILKIPPTGIPNNTPQEKALYVAGNFNNWEPGRADCKLNKQADGHYEVLIDSLIDGDTIEYKFTCGDWQHVETTEKGGFIGNRKAAVLDGAILEHRIENWNMDYTPTNSTKNRKNVHIISTDFPIPQLNRTRRIWVYLPPDYDLSNNRYPVIYLQDGQNLFDDATSFSGEWGIDDAMELLFAGGDLGAIVVGVDNGGISRLDEYSPWVNPQSGGGEGEKYMKFITQTLKPHIDTAFRTLPTREHTAIGGSSMGGLISMYGGIANQDIFSKILVFSPSFWFSPNCFSQVEEKGHQFPMRIYLLCGTPEGKGSVERDLLKMKETLLKSGFDASEIKYITKPDGQHSEWFWRREFPDAYQWLFETYSESVAHSVSDDMPFVLNPVPFIDKFTIEWKEATQFYTVALFNSTGQNVYIQAMTGNQEVNITGFPKGVYLLIIEEKGRVFRKKILKE